MDGGIAPDTGGDGMMTGDDGHDGGSMAHCYAMVPLDQISIDGTPPSAGDTVDFSVGGTVSDITGNYARVDIKDINGEAVDTGEGNDGGTGNESTAQMGDRLRGKAAQADQQSSMRGY